MNKMKEFFNERALNWDKRPSMKSYEYYLDFVSNELQLKKGDKVLDLACGTGVITNQIYDVTQTNVIGMDLSDKMIEVANLKNKNPLIRFVSEDFYDTKLKGFDVIIAHNAYPHFMDKVGFKHKCLDMLNPHGRLIICYTNDRNLINEKHKSMDKDLFHEILSCEEEANLYKDTFKIIKEKEEQVYVLILEKL